MVKAVWNETVVAASDDTVVVEGNHYFPLAAVDRAVLRDSTHTSVCPWKGTAHYYTIVANGQENLNAAWYYPEPKAGAANIKDRVAFWRGVKVA